MSDPEFQNDDLARRLEWATSDQPSAADADGEAAQWRESWVSLSRHLEDASPPLDTSALLAKLQAELEPAAVAPAVISPRGPAGVSDNAPRGAWWLAAAAVVAASIAGGWWAVRQMVVTGDGDPNGPRIVENKKNEIPDKNSTPEKKPSVPAVVDRVIPKSPAPEEKVSPEAPSPEELALTAWDDTAVAEALTQVQTQVYGAGSEWVESERLNLLDERLQELEKQMDDGSL